MSSIDLNVDELNVDELNLNDFDINDIDNDNDNNNDLLENDIELIENINSLESNLTVSLFLIIIKSPFIF